MRKIYSSIVAALLCLAAFAQEPVSDALPFIQIDQNPASVAMGSSRIHSAASVFLDDFNFAGGVTFQNYMPKLDGTSYIGAGAAGKYGDLGFSLSFVRGSGEEIDEYNFTPSESLINLGAAYNLGLFALGVNVKLAKEQVLSNHQNSAVAADLFASARFGAFDVEGGISSIGQKVKSQSTGSFSLPTAASLSGCYSAGEEHHISARARADVFFSGGISAGLGVEYAWNGQIFARTGYHYGGNSPVPSFASAGLGLHIADFNLNAAYLFASDVLANSFAVSFGVSF